jgi:hypothetical protein
MIRLLTILGLLACIFLLSTAPWASAVAYTLVSILQPQYVWFWSFESIPIFKITAGLAIIAWCIEAGRGNINWKVYKTWQFKGLLLLWAWMHFSNMFSPFSSYFAGIGGDLVLGTMNTIVIMYFIVLGLINTEKSLTWFAYTLVLIGIYYTYWANDHYLSNNWGQFTDGRLRGPRGSPYGDGNALSIVLIVCMPFVLFGIQHFKQKWLQVLMILSLPLMWHALILFASRGAMLSAGVLTLFAASIMKSKMLNKALVLGFLIVIIDQGGTLLQRTKTTVAAAQTESEAPLNPRLVSWDIGTKLIAKYPIFGAGPQRFQVASATHFPGKSPHVAHNTFLNFSVNTGLLTGVVFISFFFASYRQYKKVKDATEFSSTYNYINRCCGAALLGFFVGAIFLDLIIFEPFYFLLALISGNYILATAPLKEIAVE